MGNEQLIIPAKLFTYHFAPSSVPKKICFVATSSPNTIFYQFAIEGEMSFRSFSNQGLQVPGIGGDDGQAKDGVDEDLLADVAILEFKKMNS